MKIITSILEPETLLATAGTIILLFNFLLMAYMWFRLLKCKIYRMKEKCNRWNCPYRLFCSHAPSGIAPSEHLKKILENYKEGEERNEFHTGTTQSNR